jgi:hypothetical protein
VLTHGLFQFDTHGIAQKSSCADVKLHVCSTTSHHKKLL